MRDVIICKRVSCPLGCTHTHPHLLLVDAHARLRGEDAYQLLAAEPLRPVVVQDEVGRQQRVSGLSRSANQNAMQAQRNARTVYYGSHAAMPFNPTIGAREMGSAQGEKQPRAVGWMIRKKPAAENSPKFPFVALHNTSLFVTSPFLVFSRLFPFSQQ